MLQFTENLVKKITLADFDNRLMDGFAFCRKVYAFLDQTHKDASGTGRLRLRSDRAAKKLLEELQPITHYIRLIYMEGRTVRVRWVDGSQSYDGVLLSSGILVEKHLAKKRQLIEITSAVHEKDHLRRRLLHEQGHVWGLEGITYDKKTKKLTSEPIVVDRGEQLDRFVSKIREVIAKKCKKNYPQDTVLIVHCTAETVMYEWEWESVVEKLRESETDFPFAEIFLYEGVRYFTARFYRPRKD